MNPAVTVDVNDMGSSFGVEMKKAPETVKSRVLRDAVCTALWGQLRLPRWPIALSVFCPHRRYQLGLLFWKKKKPRGFLQGASAGD
jgi:hypothetical protein